MSGDTGIGFVRLSVRPFVYLSNAGIVSKRLYIHVFSLSCRANTFVFELYRLYKIPTVTPSMGALNTRGKKSLYFLQKSTLMSETVQDKPMLTMDH